MKKRRRFSAEFKARLALDIPTGALSRAEACRRHNFMALRKGLFLKRAHLIFESDVTRIAEQTRITELEQVLGRITLENGILKKSRPGWPESRRETKDHVVA